MVSPPSPHSSCASTKPNQEGNHNNNNNNNNNNDNDNDNNDRTNNNNNNENNNNNNPKAPSLVLVGCPHYLMYLMISDDNLKCPKCKSANLIHFT
ncbi:hypothetical protein JHK82_027290 [Glycine max]|uniref:GIR1-like zinc ribbon domain-containing protein n=1 Tax=Glycine soja TaxID=3848 RepID=A0A0B2SP57_GLYSO|nr:hypothetical protein JHK82_027290 [Glycine max]KHN48411.1 hypothetical protein glysoja_034458 [Glycine soja]RZB86249.1 hypothetical protein D0Y65_026357 [Glycine soja]